MVNRKLWVLETFNQAQYQLQFCVSTHSSPEGAATELESGGNRTQESFVTSNNVLFLCVSLYLRDSNVFCYFCR